MGCSGGKKCCRANCNSVCVDPQVNTDELPLVIKGSSQAIGDDYINDALAVDDVPLDEAFAMGDGDFAVDESFAVQDPNSGILPETKSDPAKLPAWAIAVIVVFAAVFIGLIAVLVQLFLLHKSQ